MVFDFIHVLHDTFSCTSSNVLNLIQIIGNNSSTNTTDLLQSDIFLKFKYHKTFVFTE